MRANVEALIATEGDIARRVLAKVEQGIQGEQAIELDGDDARLVVSALEREPPRRSAFASRRLRLVLYERLGYQPPSGH